MQRRYEVYIEGKPLVIADAAPGDVLHKQWLALRVDGPGEMERAIALLHGPEPLQGVLLFPAPGLDIWSMFKESYVFVQAAGGVVLDERGRLLAIRRLGKWDLPKGKVDPGEGIEAAAVREVQEECGIASLELVGPIAVTWHTYERKGKQYLKRTDWFRMKASSAQPLTPETEENIEEVRWVGREEAGMLKEDTYASLLPVIDAWLALT